MRTLLVTGFLLLASSSCQSATESLCASLSECRMTTAETCGARVDMLLANGSATESTVSACADCLDAQGCPAAETACAAPCGPFIGAVVVIGP